MEAANRFKMLLVGAAALLYVLMPTDLMPALPFDDIAAVIIAILVIGKDR